ncbi:hypothetical protein [Mesorhizobium erdmanii]|uniref:Uncharacterized protein n=1 Tax=Mesorhizobium erdmanii TaxID=1777866 RepID=A0A6M7UA18_9HYPH|nr:MULTISPECIES: hypothetical protein [Mesorhizobium]OBQ67806.1 hypothetical protein A8146_10190 [Mesorhizobium loti]QKC74171.1 hypothetical protein EB233_00415 [Mesorhizobium erdmanii]
MRVILGGKFESALIRALDEVNLPHQNRNPHTYYLGLNRKSDPIYFERSATFLAIADQTLMPAADWSGAADHERLSARALGLKTQVSVYKEWDKEAKEASDYASLLLDKRILTNNTIRYISYLDLSDLADEDRAQIEIDIKNIERLVSEFYLSRLFMQLRLAGDQKVYLVLDENDIKLLSEISAFIRGGGTPPAFAFPDLDAQVILGSKFAGGLFNFAPPDAESVAAVRADPVIQKYARKVRLHLGEQASLESEKALVEAMRQSNDVVQKERKAAKVFEVVSWVAKPLHYIPMVDAFMSVAEDIKDVADKLLERDTENREWHLLASRATQVSIEEYLQRRQNL